MRESIQGKVSNVRWVQGHFEWQKHWLMTVKDSEGNKWEGTIPRGVNVKPGDAVQFEAEIDRRLCKFKRPTRFKHDTHGNSKNTGGGPGREPFA